jgi:hypothetical protein
MKKIIILITALSIFATAFAFNPSNYIPADVDAALEISIPEEIVSMLGVDSDMLAELAPGILNTDIELQDMKAYLYGKFGLSTYLFEALDMGYMYDLTDILDSEMAISALAAMPMCVITNAVNMDTVFGFLEGPAMQEAVEFGVNFDITMEDVAGHSVKHFKVRFYDDYEPVFFDLYFAELEEGYYLAASEFEMLKTSLEAAADEKLRLTEYDRNMAMTEDYFIKFQNNTLSFSSALMRMMNIFHGKVDSEFIGVGIGENEIFLDFYADMAYISDSFEKNTEIYKTDLDFFNAMPSFEGDYEITNFISIPRTGLPLEFLGEVLYELPMIEAYVDDLENYFELLPLMGPELERVNLCFSEKGYMPYMLAKCTDAKMVFDNFVKMYEIETATVGYIEYSYGDDVYIGYDSRYNYIEIYAFDLASFQLRQGELLFTEKLKSDEGLAYYVADIPEYLWGTIRYNDFVTLDVEFDEIGDFSAHFAFDLSTITEMQAAQEREQAMYDISNGYVQIMNYITDQLYYYPEDELGISDIYDGVLEMYMLEPEMLEQFKISMGKSGDKPVYNIYYNGSLPEGTTVDDLRRSVEYNIYYYGDYTVEIKGDIVLLRVMAE